MCFLPGFPSARRVRACPAPPCRRSPVGGREGPAEGRGRSGSCGERGHGRRGKAGLEEGQALSGSCRACRSPEARRRRRRAEAASEGLSVTVPQRLSRSEAPAKRIPHLLSLKEGPSVRVLVKERPSARVSQCLAPRGWAVLCRPTAGDRETRDSVRVPVPAAVSQTAPSSHGLAGDAEALEMFWEAK